MDGIEFGFEFELGDIRERERERTERAPVEEHRAVVPLEHLREELRDVAVIIPFGRVDGLGVSINRIVDRMEEDLSANVPHAIRSAFNDVVTATLAQVKARVKAGDVVVA